MGLGLTITRAIANAYHGTIRVASTVDEGTTFTLNLPVRDCHGNGVTDLAATPG